MSTRTPREQAASRAEARRRARLAARGDVAETTTDEEPDTTTAGRGGGFLSRIFPPAPPLPNKPDPLAGFDPNGPMRPVRERFFLLRSNLPAWLATGIVAFIGVYASIRYEGDPLGLVATFVQFGALIAAGWFGWQRPALYGAAAGALSGVLLTMFVLIDYLNLGAGPEILNDPTTVLSETLVTIAYLTAFGFLGGWYGGYLRRRQTHLSGERRRR